MVKNRVRIKQQKVRKPPKMPSFLSPDDIPEINIPQDRTIHYPQTGFFPSFCALL